MAHALEAAVLVALALLLFLVLAEGREMPLPQALSDRIEARAEAAFASGGEAAALDLGRIAVAIEEGGQLRLRAEDVRLGAAEGAGGVSVPALEAALGPGSLLTPGRAPRALVLRGAALDVTRRADGQLDFGFGTLRLLRRTPAEAIARIRGLLAREAMAPLQSLRLEGLSLTFRDARAGRVWHFDDATLSVTRTGGEIAVALDADLPGRVSLRLTVPEAGPPTARLSALVDGVPAADLAAQAPALGWLAPLEAPVSGALIGRLGAAGALGPVDGTLEIGPGRLAPEGGRPLRFDRAQAYFSYRPEGGRVTFTSLAVEAPGLSLSASGHADLAGPAGEWPEALTAQLAIDAGEIRAGPALPGPLLLADGAIDARIALAPFAAEIGQAGVTVVTEGGAAPAEATPVSLPADPGAPGLRLTARGRVAAEAGGWAASLDLGADEAGPAQVLALWPVGAAPGTRDWVARNVLSGRIERPRAGLRLSPGERPRLAATFGFREGRVRPLRGFPPVEGGRGRAALGENRFTVSLEAGRIAPAGDGPIDLAGTAFVIADTRLQPADGDLRLAASGPVASALALLDLPPLSLLSRAGLSADLAEGRADVAGRLRFAVGRGARPGAVGYDVTGTLAALRSETLVPGRALTSDRLALAVDPTELTLEGRAALDGVPLEGAFRLPIGPDAGPARVTARAPLSAGSAGVFGVALPPGALSGETEADLRLTLGRGAAPALSVASTLEGLALRLPGLGWSKPADASGRLELAGRLGFQGAPPAFDTVALEAPGLTARGRLALAPGGGLDRLTLETARLGGWFDGALALVGRGAGRPPAVELAGGTLDLAAARLGGDGSGGGGSGGGGGPPPVSGRLDRLALAEGVALTGVTADLAPSGGALAGPFRGRLDGGPPVTGELGPGQGGRPSVRVQTGDAGRALAAAGAFEEARGGTLTLTLAPEAQPGAWRGTLEVGEIRVTAAPGLAALFNTLSVVGLLERLNGPGLLFSAIEASFRLTPGAVQLTSASAVGPALGISADGIYDMAGDRIDIQGVLSPIYFVNSIGQIVSREGEGLFGFNYRVRGPAGSPAVTVNPLSILTPGAFRQIFRAAPPELPESR